MTTARSATTGNGHMDSDAARRFLLDHFRAHAIKGELKPTRTYEVVEWSSTKLKISTRNGDGRWVQTLFADLITCKSLKYGEFRRVDLFWGADRRDFEAAARPRLLKRATSADGAIRSSIPGPTFLPDGELMPVDTFMSHRLGPARRARKEKAS